MENDKYLYLIYLMYESNILSSVWASEWLFNKLWLTKWNKGKLNWVMCAMQYYVSFFIFIDIIFGYVIIIYFVLE